MSKSKHNYTQYSNNKKHNNVDAIDNVIVGDVMPEPEVNETVTNVVGESLEINMVEETVETVTLPETVVGVVAGCSKLNVRVAPNAIADVACTINIATEIKINLAKSTDEWFHVCTAAGIEGYCMRKFVEARV